MNKNKTHFKPHGSIGLLRVSSDIRQIKPDWQKINFPTSKEGKEIYFCQKFIDWWHKKRGVEITYVDNTEDDFDFELFLPGGNVHMDLAELVIKDVNGNPFQNIFNKPIKYDDFSHSILEIVKEKNEKYKSKSKIPIHLLFYYTHYRFCPNHETEELIKHDLRNISHIFENIFLYHTLDKEEGEVSVLFPNTNNYPTFDFEKLREKLVLNLNPDKWELIE